MRNEFLGKDEDSALLLYWGKSKYLRFFKLPIGSDSADDGLDTNILWGEACQIDSGSHGNGSTAVNRALGSPIDLHKTDTIPEPLYLLAPVRLHPSALKAVLTEFVKREMRWIVQLPDILIQHSL